MGTIDLAALEIFKAVAEQGGITKAAARLHRVQSNVTTRVKQLEERLGTRLFLRQHRRLVLSAEGKLSCSRTPIDSCASSSEAEAALQNDVPLRCAPDRRARERGGDAAAADPVPLSSRLPRRADRARAPARRARWSPRSSTHEVEAAFVAEPFIAGRSRDAAGVHRGARPHHPEALPPDHDAEGHRAHDAHRVRQRLLVPAPARGVARRRRGGARARHGVRLVPRDRGLRRRRRRGSPSCRAPCVRVARVSGEVTALALAAGRVEGADRLRLAPRSISRSSLDAMKAELADRVGRLPVLRGSPARPRTAERVDGDHERASRTSRCRSEHRRARSAARASASRPPQGRRAAAHRAGALQRRLQPAGPGVRAASCARRTRTPASAASTSRRRWRCPA